jgi:hypothetical protein
LTVGRVTIRLGLCPSPGQQKGIWYRTPSKEIRYTKIDDDRIKISIPLIKVGRQVSDQIIRIALCPELMQCGCSYEAEVGWEILGNCEARLSWQWPEDAGCLLKAGTLSGAKSGVVQTEELATDPDMVIYPMGDSRNPDCPGCGMAGADREAVEDTPVPGERFTLTGCIDEEACIAAYGAGGCRPIGSELFQTVGFMGGLIHDVFDEAARIYEVMVDEVLTGAKGTDLTKYTIGQWVALAKIGTEFPFDEWEGRLPVTNANVPAVGVEEYIIVPFTFAGAA